MNRYKPKRILKTDAMNESHDGMPAPGGIVGNLETGAEVHLVEVDTGHIAKARKALGRKVHVCWGDIRDLPFEDGEFDLILDMSTLDHVPRADMPGVLDEYKRVLEFGGHLGLVSWATNAAEEYITNFDGSWSPGYACYFKFADLLREVRDRFQIVERQEIYKDGQGFLVYLLGIRV